MVWEYDAEEAAHLGSLPSLSPSPTSLDLQSGVW